jgi:glycosyltransferase involved in cell wall biosynthesis
MTAFSIIILTWKRLTLLKKCLASIAASDCFLTVEVIVILNGPDPETRSYLETCQHIQKVYMTERKGRGEARNIGVDHSSGDILYFCDDDVVHPPHLFRLIHETFQKNSNIDIIGGPNIGRGDESDFQRACSCVLSSPLGSGPYYKRYKKLQHSFLADDAALILCNLATRKKIFKTVRFEKNVISAEENIFLQEALAQGYKALHVPEAYVYHLRSDSLKQFFKKYLSYGRGRADNAFIRPSSSVMHFGIVVVLSAIFFISIKETSFVLALHAGSIYLFFVLAIALFFCKKNQLPLYRYGKLFVCIVILLHAAYFLGFMLELGRNYIDFFSAKIKRIKAGRSDQVPS